MDRESDLASLISANEAGRRLKARGLPGSIPDLIQAAREERVACRAIVPRGNRFYFYFDEEELVAAVERLVCKFAGCQEHTLGRSTGYCPAHALEAERDRRQAEKAAERDWLVQAEATEYKGVGIDAIKGARKRGELACERHGNQVRIRRADLDAWTPKQRGGQRRLEKRECAYRECSVDFQPKHDGRKHCSLACGLAEREARERDEIEKAKQDGRWLEVSEFAARLGVSPKVVSGLYVARGYLPARRLKTITGGKSVILIEEQAAHRFEIDWARSLDENRWRASWADAEKKLERLEKKIVATAERRGLSPRAMKDLEAEIKQRAEMHEALLKNRRRGKRPHGGPPAYHFEWASRFAELKAELDENYAWHHVKGDRPPTNHGVALLVAEEDFDQHPERWDYLPSEASGEAARRVWKAVKAVKPLLITGTEIQAA